MVRPLRMVIEMVAGVLGLFFLLSLLAVRQSIAVALVGMGLTGVPLAFLVWQAGQMYEDGVDVAEFVSFAISGALLFLFLAMVVLASGRWAVLGMSFVLLLVPSVVLILWNLERRTTQISPV